MSAPRTLSPAYMTAAGGLGVAVFLLLTLPTVSTGAVVGTGQDEWYNMIRALQVLYERGNPSYFIHPALYYEVLALVYAGSGIVLRLSGAVASGQFLDYVLAHQPLMLTLARAVSVGGGALAVLAAASLGGRLSGAGAAVLASLLVALLPLLHTLAASIRVDTVSLAAWLVATALVVRYHDAGTRRALRHAAYGIGVAAAANYSGALLLLPLGWLALTRRDAAPLMQRLGGFASACAIAGAVFLTLNPYVVIDPANFLRWFAFQANVAVVTHPNAEPPSPTYYLQLIRAQGLPIELACAAAVLAMARPRSPGGALALFAVLYLMAFSAMRSQYDRFALPAMALLCVVGAAWACAQVSRAGRGVATAAVGVATFALLGTAWATLRHPPAPVLPDPDYRAEMMTWILDHLPETAVLMFESDTLPLLQTMYDPGGAHRPFAAALRSAFARTHPHLPRDLIKTQFIAAIYNYDPELLDDGRVFFLSSTQSRHYFADHPTTMTGPTAFYAALDARGAVVHQTEGNHEQLTLYEIGPAPSAPASTAP